MPRFMNHCSIMMLVSFIAVCIMSTNAYACACCNTYKVVKVKENDQLTVRSGPGPEFKSIAWLHHNETCILKTSECKNSWCKIKFGSISGWVYTPFLARVSPEKTNKATGK